MNDRIKELSEQAQLYARQGMGKCVIELKRFDKDAVSERYAKDFEEKFAELIVRECVTAFEAEVDTWKEMDPYQGSIKRQGTKAIKQHFGVEE